MSFVAKTLCVVSQLVFIVVSVYFIMTQSGNFWIHSRFAVVKNAWMYNCTPLYVFIGWCLVKHSIRLLPLLLHSALHISAHWMYRVLGMSG
jgi:hypothetical protein